jgi:hypothetical protein
MDHLIDKDRKSLEFQWLSEYQVSQKYRNVNIYFAERVWFKCLGSKAIFPFIFTTKRRKGWIQIEIPSLIISRLFLLRLWRLRLFPTRVLKLVIRL